MTIGGSIFGIVGAFLVVPVAACLVVTARYFSEQLDLRTGDTTAAELPVETAYGYLAAADGERASSSYRSQDDSAAPPPPPPGPDGDRAAADATSSPAADDRSDKT